MFLTKLHPATLDHHACREEEGQALWVPLGNELVPAIRELQRIYKWQLHKGRAP
jgi:hypothetical protein